MSRSQIKQQSKTIGNPFILSPLYLAGNIDGKSINMYSIVVGSQD